MVSVGMVHALFLEALFCRLLRLLVGDYVLGTMTMMMMMMMMSLFFL
jgi:hypothetical protein